MGEIARKSSRWPAAEGYSGRGMRVRISYARSRDLLDDYDQQLTRNGILVRVEPPADVELFAAVELELVTPVGSRRVAAQVIQTMPGVGIAVGFDAAAAATIEALVDAVRGAPETPGDPPRHELVTEAATPPGGRSSDMSAAAPDDGAERAVVDIHTRLRTASVREKMQIALHGSKDERALIIRDPTAKMLHHYVLKNPKLQLDEVAAIAGMRTVSADVLKYIAGRRDWAQRPDVAAALVRNPKTPVPLAIRLMNNLSVAELRQLAKSGGVREAIQREARKKVL